MTSGTKYASAPGQRRMPAKSVAVSVKLVSGVEESELPVPEQPVTLNGAQFVYAAWKPDFHVQMSVTCP